MDMKKMVCTIGALATGGIAGTVLGKKIRKNLVKKVLKEEEDKKVYCLFMEKMEDGVIKDYDIFGVYSTREKAEEAKTWRKREDELYQGVRPDLVYNRCAIDARVIDNNLPIHEEP